MLGMKLIVVVLDNRGFGCINRLQQACGGAPFNNLLDDCIRARRGAPTIDFAAHAAALGARAENVANIAELEAALARARASDRTYVIVHRDRSRPHDRGGRLVVGRRGARSVAAREGARGARALRARRKDSAMSADDSRGVSGDDAASTCASASIRSRGATTTCRRSAARRRSRWRSPKARRSAIRASSSATSFRANRRRCAACWRRTGSRSCRAGIRGGSRGARVDEEIAAVGPHLRCSPKAAPTVMVYGEVADSIQGATRAAVQAAALRARAQWREYGERVTAFARHTLDARRAPRVSPSHGRVRRDARGRRPADGEHRRRRRPAVRQRPHDVRRRRCGRRCWRSTSRRVCHVHCKDVRPRRDRAWRAIATGAFSNRSSTARSPCRATAPSTFAR